MCLVVWKCLTQQLFFLFFFVEFQTIPGPDVLFNSSIVLHRCSVTPPLLRPLLPPPSSFSPPSWHLCSHSGSVTDLHLGHPPWRENAERNPISRSARSQYGLRLRALDLRCSVPSLDLAQLWAALLLIQNSTTAGLLLKASWSVPPLCSKCSCFPSGAQFFSASWRASCLWWGWSLQGAPGPALNPPLILTPTPYSHRLPPTAPS